MPAAASKRTLGTDNSTTSKKRKVEGEIRNSRLAKLSQNVPKSSFEEELGSLSQEIAELKDGNAERDQKWARPDLDPSWNPQTDNLLFQQIDVEEGMLDGKSTIRLFGVTETGHSVLLHVTDFLHYLYVAAPISFTRDHLMGYTKYLESNLSYGRNPVIQKVEIVMRENLYHYNGNQKSPYLKISVSDSKQISRVRTFIGESNWNGMWPITEGGLMTFDNIQYVMRFMVDTKVSGMSWIEAPAGAYELLSSNDLVSTCQIEAQVSYKNLIAHSTDGEYAKMAPLRILSFDIECAGRKGIFPEANHDPIIQIANVVTRYGENKPFIRNVFCLDTCSLIINTQLFEFGNEKEMLLEWKNFLQQADPDVIIGYNTANFDMPYLLDRAKHLGATNFPYWTRLSNVKTDAKNSNFSSKQMGNRDTKATNTNGRLQVDLLQVIQRDYQLRSYTLNSVSAHFLGEQKEDVHHSMITELFNGTPESRRRLAVYCLKDAYLPQRLLDKLMCLVNYTEMARVTGVPFNYLLSRGQQIKFLSQIFRKALEEGLVIPNLLQNNTTEDQYEGATVIEPTKGYYDVPIATLDFASLYPSIMQAHNLCYTTLLRKETARRLNLKEGEDYTVTPNGDWFVKATRRKGMIPLILEGLLGARKRAKADLKNETDPFKKAVLNGRQLALKISANSVYGITGATIGKLPCLQIASSVTSYGRQMIEKTREEVEKHYTIANGYEHDAQVIYGDTDSVMVKFGPKDLPTAMKLGEEAAALVSSRFISPIKLEFEKVYFPYLLINKKRYAGLYWTRTDKYDKMDSKGIETVRRDNCRLVQVCIETVLKKLLIDQDVEGAQSYVKNLIADLLQNRVDMSQLVITKALSKADYKSKQAHTELAERMKSRDAGSAPTLGDRVAYVITRGAREAKNYEKSEDPIYVLEHSVPIDTKYYLDNQLAKPLGRIFEPIIGERKAQQLLTGDHTRTISVTAPSVGGLMKFAKKTQTCMGCKAPLTKKGQMEGAVCENCRPRFGELYQKSLSKVNEMQVRFGRLWTQCQRCQGAIHCEVICSNKDCPIFYMRMKARKDLQDRENELKRFDLDEIAW
ncbi:DNA polymerase delta catalytic subunit [Trichophaea hybrida]|nr:DNA polymerase delta catalytic subunit [Trichophaea hybrida]